MNQKNRNRLNRVIGEAVACMKAPENLTVSEWADRYRRLSSVSSAEPGQWRTSRTPYLKDIMDAFTDPQVRDISVVAASQVGKYEFELNCIGYIIDQDPASILYIHPTVDDAKKFSRLRVTPMVSDTPVIQKKVKETKVGRESASTILQKSFPGGMLTITGSNSASALASTPARFVIADEVDRFARSAGREGDPLSLAKARQTTFYNAKTLLVSTPTIKGDSRIEAAYYTGTQERWCHRCPDCGRYSEIRFNDIKFEPHAERVRGKKA